MAVSFMKPVDREVKSPVFQLGVLRALGPDGMSGIFNHRCWNIVGNGLVDALISFIENGSELKGLKQYKTIDTFMANRFNKKSFLVPFWRTAKKIQMEGP